METCDVCPGDAAVTWRREDDGLELVFCQHHSDHHGANLDDGGWTASTHTDQVVRSRLLDVMALPARSVKFPTYGW